jgi:hypothetical protein
MARTEDKIVKLVDGENPSIQATIKQLGLSAALATFIMAENADSPGTYSAIQGRFDDDGKFYLLTSGTGEAPPTASDGYWNSSNTNWNDTNINWNQT